MSSWGNRHLSKVKQNDHISRLVSHSLHLYIPCMKIALLRKLYADNSILPEYKPGWGGDLLCILIGWLQKRNNSNKKISYPPISIMPGRIQLDLIMYNKSNLHRTFVFHPAKGNFPRQLFSYRHSHQCLGLVRCELVWFMAVYWPCCEAVVQHQLF